MRPFWVLVALVCLLSAPANAQEDCSVDGINAPNLFPISVSEHGQILLVPFNGKVSVWDELNGITQLEGYNAIGILFTKVNKYTQVIMAQGSFDPFNVPRILWDSVRGYRTLDLLHTYAINDDELIAGHDVNDPTRFVIKNPYTGVEVYSSFDPMFAQDYQGFYLVTKSRHLAQVGGRVVYFWDGVEYTKYQLPVSQVYDMSDTGYVVGSDGGVGFWWTRQTGVQPVPSRTADSNAAWSVNDEGKMATVHGVYDAPAGQFITSTQSWAIANNGQVTEGIGTVNLRSTKLAMRPSVDQVVVTADGNTVALHGTNIMPGARIYLDVPFPPLFVNEEGTVAYAETASVPDGVYHARVVNPNGCGSEEIYEITLVHGQPVCGLLGIEAFALLAFIGFLRRRL